MVKQLKRTRAGVPVPPILSLYGCSVKWSDGLDGQWAVLTNLSGLRYI